MTRKKLLSFILYSLAFTVSFYYYNLATIEPAESTPKASEAIEELRSSENKEELVNRLTERLVSKPGFFKTLVEVDPNLRSEVRNWVAALADAPNADSFILGKTEPGYAQFLPKYMRTTSDKAAIELLNAMSLFVESISKRNPDACGIFTGTKTDGVKAVLDEVQNLPEPVLERIRKARIDIVVQAVKNPQEPPKQEKIVELLTQLDKKAAEIEQSVQQDSSVSCKQFSVLHRTLTSLPQESDRAILIRGLINAF